MYFVHFHSMYFKFIKIITNNIEDKKNTIHRCRHLHWQRGNCVLLILIDKKWKKKEDVRYK